MSVSKLILPTRKTANELKAEMLKRLGDISGIHVYHNYVLGMVFIQEKYGSLIASDGYKKEDEYQGKILTVLKMGPSAFVPTKGWSWDVPVAVGDWVVTRPSDGMARMINGQMCRLFRDENVTEKLDHPENLR
jgi:hypothetical protein